MLLNRHVSDIKFLVLIGQLRVVVAEEVQKLPDGHVLCSVGRHVGVVEVGKLALTVHLLPQQKVLFMAHNTALPDQLSVLFHGYHRFQLLQGTVRHVAQRDGKFQTSGLAELPGQSWIYQLRGFQRRAGRIDADLVLHVVCGISCACVYLVAHRLAPRYLMVTLLAAVAVKVRVTVSPSGISSPSRYCHSVVLARLPA